MNIQSSVTHEVIFNAILNERNGSGIRSRYPRYYVWSEDKLYLVGAIGVMNLGAGSSSTRNFNIAVAQLLDKKEIPYFIQNIAAHSSRMAPIVYYSKNTPESTWKGMEIAMELEAWARRGG